MEEKKIRFDIRDVDTLTNDDAIAILDEWNNANRKNNDYPLFDDEEFAYFVEANKKNLHKILHSILMGEILDSPLEEGQHLTRQQISVYNRRAEIILRRIYNMLRTRNMFNGRFDLLLGHPKDKLAEVLLHTWKTGKKRQNPNKRKREEY